MGPTYRRETFYMELLELIRERRSTRAYQPRPVEREKVERVLEAARLAPSACNRQAWEFYVVQDKEKRAAIKEAADGAAFLGEAPLILVACGLQGVPMPCGQRTDSVDLSIAMAFAILEAQELGLGTCWMGAFNAEGVQRALGLPEGTVPVMITPLGYPAQAPAARPRKALSEVARWC